MSLFEKISLTISESRKMRANYGPKASKKLDERARHQMRPGQAKKEKIIGSAIGVAGGASAAALPSALSRPKGRVGKALSLAMIGAGGVLGGAAGKSLAESASKRKNKAWKTWLRSAKSKSK